MGHPTRTNEYPCSCDSYCKKNRFSQTRRHCTMSNRRCPRFAQTVKETRSGVPWVASRGTLMSPFTWFPLVALPGSPLSSLWSPFLPGHLFRQLKHCDAFGKGGVSLSITI